MPLFGLGVKEGGSKGAQEAGGLQLRGECLEEK